MNEDKMAGPAEYPIYDKVTLGEVPDEEKAEWSSGYLTLTCHNCEYEYRVYDVPESDGRQFLLPITNFHHITLECPNCNSCITLHYVKAEGAETTLMNDVKPVSEEKAKLLAEEENESGYEAIKIGDEPKGRPLPDDPLNRS